MNFIYKTIGHAILCKEPDYGFFELFIHDEFGNLIPFVLTDGYIHFISQ